MFEISVDLGVSYGNFDFIVTAFNKLLMIDCRERFKYFVS